MESNRLVTFGETNEYQAMLQSVHKCREALDRIIETIRVIKEEEYRKVSALRPEDV